MDVSKVPKEQGGPRRRRIRKNMEECFRMRWGRERREAGGARKEG